MIPRIVPLGDACLSIVFDETIDPAINAQCIAMAGLLAQAGRPGIRDIVPTYNAVTVHYDPLRLDREGLSTELAVLAGTDFSHRSSDREPIIVPVEYGGEFGPDLASVAEFARCSEAEVVQFHSRKVYRVYMLGFLPGFAYMGTVDARLAVPRLDSPRLRVPAGAVAIAGSQTGVYPFDTPGGWRIIGRTATKVFDSSRDSPFLLQAGDLVKFVVA